MANLLHVYYAIKNEVNVNIEAYVMQNIVYASHEKQKQFVV